MFKLARVQSRGQVTLPREVRERLGIKPKDMLVFQFDPDGQIRLDLIPFVTADELFARYTGDGQPADVEEAIRDGEQDAADEFLRNMGFTDVRR